MRSFNKPDHEKAHPNSTLAKAAKVPELLAALLFRRSGYLRTLSLMERWCRDGFISTPGGHDR